MDGRAGYPRLEGLYLAVWEGGVWGGEYDSRCWDIIALTEVNYCLLRINSRGSLGLEWLDPGECHIGSAAYQIQSDWGN
jgi:hypothetical protein